MLTTFFRSCWLQLVGGVLPLVLLEVELEVVSQVLVCLEKRQLHGRLRRIAVRVRRRCRVREQLIEAVDGISQLEQERPCHIYGVTAGGPAQIGRPGRKPRPVDCRAKRCLLPNGECSGGIVTHAR